MVLAGIFVTNGRFCAISRGGDGGGVGDGGGGRWGVFTTMSGRE